MRTLEKVLNRAGAPALAPPTRPGGQSWYQIRNAVGSPEADLWVYDEIGMWGLAATDLVRDLGDVKAGVINLHINSPGGEVFDGIAIYNALRAHPAAIHVVIDGLAASIASVIAMAGDTVRIAPNATVMIHEGHMVAIGDAAEMRKAAELLDRCSNNIASIYATHAGHDVEHWRGLMRAETWFNAKEAVASGLADEVLATKPTKTAPSNHVSWDLRAYNYAGYEAYVAARATGQTVATPPAAPPAPVVVEFTPVDIGAPLVPEPLGAVDLAATWSGFAGLVDAAVNPPPLTFDTNLFRAAMDIAANDAPMPEVPAMVLPDRPAAPAPAPVPVDSGVVLIDPELFRTAMSMAANDAPMPYVPTAAPSEPPTGPTFGFDPKEFARMMKEAAPE